MIYAVYPPGIRLISYLPQFADTRGFFILALNDRSRVRCCRSHSTILNNPVERNASRKTFITQLHSQCVSSVRTVDLSGQNGYEKDQGSIGNGQKYWRNRLPFSPMNFDHRRYSEGHDIPTEVKVTDIECVVSNVIGICPSSSHPFCLNKTALSMKQGPMGHARPDKWHYLS